MTAADMDVQPAQRASHGAATVGDWRRQDHTIFLAVLVIVNVCLDLVALRPGGSQVVGIVWAGALLAQTFLMGLWMAFGGLHVLLRAFLVASITAGGALAASVSVGASFGGSKGAFLQLAPIAGTALFAT